MRISAALLVMVGLMSTAMADEPRYRPAVGTIATFRTLFATRVGGKEMVSGYVYRLTTIASNDTVSEATLTPLALLYRCAEGETANNCLQVQNYPNIMRDRDLVTVPIPPEISAGFTKIGKVTMHDFLRTSQVFPVPGPEDIHKTAKPQIGATPLFIETGVLDCDEAAIKPFFPLGATVTLSVPCKYTLERSQSRSDFIRDMRLTEDVTYDLSFAGRNQIAVPAGDLAVTSIKYKDAPAGQIKGEWALLENIGLSARSSGIVHYSNSANPTLILRELIKLGS